MDKVDEKVSNDDFSDDDDVEEYEESSVYFWKPSFQYLSCLHASLPTYPCMCIPGKRILRCGTE